jgi:hypothetical protein
MDEPFPEVLRRIERETGIAAEIPAVASGREPGGVGTCRFPHNASLDPFPARRCLAAATGWDHQDIVIEPDRIRVLSRKEAFIFWNTWWEFRQEKR